MCCVKPVQLSAKKKQLLDYLMSAFDTSGNWVFARMGCVMSSIRVLYCKYNCF